MVLPGRETRLHHLELAGLDLADVTDAEPGVLYTLTPQGVRRRWAGVGPLARAQKEESRHPRST